MERELFLLWPRRCRYPIDLGGAWSNSRRGRSASTGNPGHKAWTKPIRRVLRGVPGLVPLLKRGRAWVIAVRREILHSFEGYRALRTQDLLVVSGGGQLDEEYGGAWRLPFAICKWVLLARLARVPCAMASVGAGMITSPASRRFISMAFRMCSYRSFRETKSRAIAADILPRASNDFVVPDLAFSLPDSELPSPVGSIRTHGSRPARYCSEPDCLCQTRELAQSEPCSL